MDKFDRETIDKYLVIAQKEYPDTDIHLLEYAISSYLLYDVEKREKPTEDHEDFIKSKIAFEELIRKKEEWQQEQECKA